MPPIPYVNLNDAVTESAPVRKPLYEYLHCELTGKVFASRQVGYAVGWEWYVDAVCEWESCLQSAVDLIETDDGDALTVDGRIVARIRLG